MTNKEQLQEWMKEDRAKGLDVQMRGSGEYFWLVEVRKCDGCGNDYDTKAIGLATLDECQDCKEKNTARHEKELAVSIGRGNEEIAQHDAFAEFWE